MSQVVIYKGVLVEPVERTSGKIRVRTKNAVDAQKAGIPFKSMEGATAIFEILVPEEELVAVD